MFKRILVVVTAVIIVLPLVLSSGIAHAGESEGSSQKNKLQGKTITVDPGHGGYDPGAVGVTGLQEKHVALKTSIKLARKLENQGAKVILTRESDYNPSYSRRVYLAHKSGSDIFISIHANHHPQPHISGTETYYHSWGSHAHASRKLGMHLQQEMVDHSGLRDIGVKHGNFYVISAPRMPSVLLELGFLSNYYDENLLKQDSFLEGQARAIKTGIISYFQS